MQKIKQIWQFPTTSGVRHAHFRCDPNTNILWHKLIQMICVTPVVVLRFSIYYRYDNHRYLYLVYTIDTVSELLSVAVILKQQNQTYVYSTVLLLTHLFIWWSCKDSSMVSKLSLYFSLPSMSVMSSAWAQIMKQIKNIHIASGAFKYQYSINSNSYNLNQTAVTHRGAAAWDSPDIPPWFPLFLRCYAPAVVELAACRRAIQLPASLVGKSPSRGHW